MEGAGGAMVGRRLFIFLGSQLRLKVFVDPDGWCLMDGTRRSSLNLGPPCRMVYDRDVSGFEDDSHAKGKGARGDTHTRVVVGPTPPLFFPLFFHRFFITLEKVLSFF